jgi:ABC-type nickel/cobalt efflux system permease component RcnA
MRKALVAVLVLVGLALPAAALAHPLGNFTVNRYSEIALSGERVYVRYALDLAEIPTYQEGSAVRAPGFAASVARNLVLELDGRRVVLTPLEHRVRARPGAGGLDTLRFDAVFAAPPGASGSALTFHDLNFERRLGWKEVVVVSSEGAEVISADVPSTSASDALRSYPADLLSSPLDVESARVRYEPGEGQGTQPPLADADAGEVPTGGFESLIARGDLGIGVILLSLLAAMFWGAAHALTPGHGKAIVAGYLVGSRGTVGHALLLGGIVTVTHTIGVFALGLVTLSLSAFVVPEQLYPWLNLVSAILVIAVGIAVLRARILSWRRRDQGHAHHHHHQRHDHHHHHHDHHHHDHHHAPEAGSGLRGLVAVGISGGLLPCPTALVVLLAAISLHRVGYGLLLILAFSVGLAAVISGIGILAISAKRVFEHMSLDGRAVRALPAVSAVLIVCLGVAMTLRTLPGLT